MGVDLILLRASGSETEVDYGQLLVLGVHVLDGLEGLVEFLHLGVELSWVSDDDVELACCLELLLSLGPLDGVASVFVFDFLIGIGLHELFIKD